MNGHVLPFFLRITSISSHSIYNSSIWIDSISRATFLISLPLSKNHSSPSTLQKDSTQSGTDVHPSPFNQAQSRENPNPPICSVLNEHRGEESGRGRTNSRNKPEELVVIRGFWIKAGGGGCQKKKKAGTYPSMVALALSFLSWAVAMVCGPDDIAREICRHCATARTTRG